MPVGRLLDPTGRPINGAAHAPSLAVVRDNPLPCLEGVELAHVRHQLEGRRLVGWRVMLKLRIGPAKGKVFAFDFPLGAHARDVARAFRAYADGLDSLAADYEGKPDAEKKDPRPSAVERGSTPADVRQGRVRALVTRWRATLGV